MKELIKPESLKRGDKVALVSLSWGGAGDEAIRWRYEQGKARLEQVFGFEVVEMTCTLAGSKYVYEHPELRAKDLMDAFLDPTIKGVITCIGGIDSIRMLPYIDYDIIRNNPKVFMGYSDTTTSHMICYKAGVSSIYGPTLLVDFAENVAMDGYTIDSVIKTLFNSKVIGEIAPAKEWTSERLPWVIENRDTQRQMQANGGYDVIQGNGSVTGRLIGGCIEVFDEHRGTPLFPQVDEFEDAILFMETSEDKPPAWMLECILRTYGVMGILSKLKGIICGKPMDEAHYDDYNKIILQVLKEFNREDMPVMCNMNFGHTEPKFCLPYGCLAKIDCDQKSFMLLESAVR